MHPDDTSPAVTRRFWSHVAKSDDGCWLWTGGIQSQWYGRMQVAGRSWLAHRLAWALASGEVPDGMGVCHHCDTPLCVRPDHLFIGTHKDNMDDRDRKGRVAAGERNGSKTHPECVARGDRSGSRLHPERLARGERHGSKTHPERLLRGEERQRIARERSVRGEQHCRAKLTEQDVRDIRRLYAASDVGQRTLAKRFDVSHGSICDVLNRKTWTHVT